MNDRWSFLHHYHQRVCELCILLRLYDPLFLFKPQYQILRLFIFIFFPFYYFMFLLYQENIKDILVKKV